MKSKKQLSDAEFKQMINLLHRYAEQSMDQWELWKFGSDRDTTYINISMKPDGPDEAYLDLDHLIEKTN